MNAVRFCAEDLELFSLASRDRNPLHLSADYARRTPFGDQVVFGVLGALACLGQLERRPGHRLASLMVDFPSPMLLGLDYTLETTEVSPERATARLFDGKRLLVKLTAGFEPRGDVSTGPDAASWIEGAAPEAELSAADLRSEDLVPGRSVAESYQPQRQALVGLRERFHLDPAPVSLAQLACLAGCSFLIGMRLPGLRALFSRLTLRFQNETAAAPLPLGFDARLVSYDRRFDLLAIGCNFWHGEALLAQGDLEAFLRQDVPPVDLDELEVLLPRAPALEGKVAMVVGASRGLGACIASALVLQGCTVVATFLKSGAAIENLRRSLAGAAGLLLPRKGDAADPAFCMEVTQSLIAERGRLDLLICNACPPLLPLWLEASSVSRLNDYVSRSVALVSAPMAAALGSLAATSGWCVAISSSAVVDAPPEWPHYVSAKHAVEGLVQVAALEFGQVSFLVPRPPRLLTDLTNTPLGRQTALSPAKVAAAVVRRIQGPPATGQVEVMADF